MALDNEQEIYNFLEPGKTARPVRAGGIMNSHRLVRGAAILAGLILLISGTGKIPGQTEFIDALLKSFWTPAVAYFIGYGLPWIETGLGILLLSGLFPRMTAVLCLPLITGFIANNSWALINGVEKFPECGSCFGIWEKFLGSVSPVMALAIDIVLLGLVLMVILLHQGDFLTFQPWFVRRKKREAL